eukprot:scaffold636725_cov33-Prasinocladus_malaysianus.AAC.1
MESLMPHPDLLLDPDAAVPFVLPRNVGNPALIGQLLVEAVEELLAGDLQSHHGRGPIRLGVRREVPRPRLGAGHQHIHQLVRAVGVRPAHVMAVEER